MHRLYFIPYHVLWFIAEILEVWENRLYHTANYCGVRYERRVRRK